MQPTLCSRCHKNVAVVFVTKIEGGQARNEGLCLKCARDLGIKPVDLLLIMLPYLFAFKFSTKIAIFQ